MLPTRPGPPLDLERLAAAKMWARERMPYLSVALFSLTPVPTPGLATVAVDQHWRLYVDPRVLDAWSVPGMGTALLHEIAHLIRDHPRRALAAAATSPQQAKDWNVAADAVINGELAELGDQLEWPVNPVLPEHIPGTTSADTVEAVYERIRTTRPPAPPAQPSPGAEPAGGGQAPSSTNPSPSTRGAAGPLDPLDEPATSGAGGMSAPDCGSCADGQTRPWEQPAPGTGTGTGTAPGLDEDETELLRKQVAEAVRAHAGAAGRVPGGWARWAEQTLNPVVDWRRELAAAVRSSVASVAGRRDFTYTRPSRRAAAIPNVITPAMRAPEPPAVAAVIDTSGSMGPDELAAALAEVDGVLRASGVSRGRCRVLACDTRTYGAQRVARGRDVHLAGGGGTDMGAGLRDAALLRPRPRIVVVLTDGHTPWPRVKPDPAADVIVVTLDDSAHPPPTWARHVDAGPARRARGVTR